MLITFELSYIACSGFYSSIPDVVHEKQSFVTIQQWQNKLDHIRRSQKSKD